MEYRFGRRLGIRDSDEWSFRAALRAVAWTQRGEWILVGDEEVKILTADNEPLRRWPTSRPAWSVTVDDEGAIWVGEPGQIEVFSAAGRLEDTWREEKWFSLVTALHVAGSNVFVGDAGTRWIHRFDRDRRLLNHLGDRHRKGGFHIPNGVVDFGCDSDGTVVVANPGMHRVERYSPEGELIDRFGRFGQQDPAGFPGCCNPTNVALGPAGAVVVSEKAGPRVKVYDRDGHLLTVVAGAADFDPACKNMDLTVDEKGSIGVVDTVDLTVAIFDRLTQTVATGLGA
jgi:hypothetical protein